MKNLNATFLSFKANSLKSGTINFGHKDEAIQASSAHRIGDNQPISVFGPLFGPRDNQGAKLPPAGDGADQARQALADPGFAATDAKMARLISACEGAGGSAGAYDDVEALLQMSADEVRLGGATPGAAAEREAAMLAEAARRGRAEGVDRIEPSRSELEAIGRDAGSVLRQAGRVGAGAGVGAPTRGVDAPEDEDDVAEAARLLEQMQVPRVHGMGMYTFA